MSAAITVDSLSPMQRGLSDWWTEETEYIFRRIERWAAFARGYNRLRSQRYSRGRLTMTDEPAKPGWNISANKLVVEDDGTWNPRFHNLQRSWRYKARPEEAQINCCGTFNYQSNNELDSHCLETYRYDHSIYFKTIGDIRNGYRNHKCSLRHPETPNELSTEISDHKQVQWQNHAISESECHHSDTDSDTNENELLSSKCEESADFQGIDIHHTDESCGSKSMQSSRVWPIINLTRLDLETDDWIEYSTDSNRSVKSDTIVQINNLDDRAGDFNDNNNNKCYFNKKFNKYEHDNENSNKGMERPRNPKKTKDVIKPDDNRVSQWTDRSLSLQKQEVESKRLVCGRKTRQSPRKVCQPTIVGENNVVWPGVLLNYKKNVNSVILSTRDSIK